MSEYIDGRRRPDHGKNPLAIVRFAMPRRAVQVVRLADVVDRARLDGIAVASIYQESTNGMDSVVRVTCSVGLAAHLVAALQQASATAYRDHDDLLVLVLAKAILAIVTAIDATEDD